jgi:hypothetical protein
MKIMKFFIMQFSVSAAYYLYLLSIILLSILSSNNLSPPFNEKDQVSQLFKTRLEMDNR